MGDDGITEEERGDEDELIEIRLPVIPIETPLLKPVPPVPPVVNVLVVSSDGGDVVGGGSFSVARSVSPICQENHGLTERRSKKKDNIVHMMVMQMRLVAKQRIHEVTEKATDRAHEAREKAANHAQLKTLTATIATGYFG